MTEPPYTTDDDMAPALGAWHEALDRRVDEHGGAVVTVVSSSEPPSVAHLTSASIRLRGALLRVAVMSPSTMARVPGRTLTAMTSLDGAALRLGASVYRRTEHAHVTVLDAMVESAALTREQPWLLESRFVSEDPGSGVALVEFWDALRAWLDHDCAGMPPPPPSRRGGGSRGDGVG
jgi:hypothetical protein